MNIRSNGLDARAGGRDGSPVVRNGSAILPRWSSHSPRAAERGNGRDGAVRRKARKKRMKLSAAEERMKEERALQRTEPSTFRNAPAGTRCSFGDMKIGKLDLRPMLPEPG